MLGKMKKFVDWSTWNSITERVKVIMIIILVTPTCTCMGVYFCCSLKLGCVHFEKAFYMYMFILMLFCEVFSYFKVAGPLIQIRLCFHKVVYLTLAKKTNQSLTD